MQLSLLRPHSALAIARLRICLALTAIVLSTLPAFTRAPQATLAGATVPAAILNGCNPQACPEEAVFPVPQGGQRGEPIIAKPGETVCVDIRLEQNPLMVNAYGYTVQFDPTRLTLQSTQRGPLVQSFMASDCNQTQPGVLSCSGFNGVGIPANSSGVLVTLCFVANGPSSATADTSFITVSNLVDDLEGMAGCCAYLITRSPQPGGCEGPALGFAAPGAALHATIHTRPDEMVTVDVRLQGFTRPVDAFAFNVNYPAARLTFVRAERGELLSGFFAAECKPAGEGILACSGSNNVAIPAQRDGVLFRLYFTAACAIGDSSHLTFDALAQDVAGASGCRNSIVCIGCDLLDCNGPALYLAPGGGVPGNLLTEQHGDTLLLEVRVKQNVTPIAAFGHRLHYNPAHLKFVDARPGNLAAAFVAATARPLQPGTLICAGFGTTAVPANSEGALLALRFAVTASADDSSALKITDLTDDLAGLNVCCSYFIGAPCEHDGDVNSNKRLTAGDAFCAFETYLNGGILPASCDLPEFQCELIAADVNCDNTITARDALAIFNRSLQALPPTECFGRGALGKSAGAPFLRLTQAPAAEGQLRLRLELTAAQPLAAFGLLLQYPARELQLLGVERSAATAEWTGLDGRQYLPGMVVIGGFHVTPLAATAPVALLDVLFRCNGAVIDNNTFAVSHLTDDLQGAQVSFALDASKTAAAPRQFRLYQNYPNPVPQHSLKQGTIIRYDLPGRPDSGNEAVPVEVTIFNLQGQVVRRLFGGRQAPGMHRVVWDGRSDAGVLVPTGTYQYRLQAGGFTDSKRLVVVK
ncbi:MAG: hypothetical protein ONB48_12780 [candidate division KSB1 bacterium]|nr:hypothetical protein [candidate division KSB1 bacterium]MDZ7275030.1 hypothetical protein [candidate division KSB1 bacterium]MDZ7286521.1 hypothetical protein [candidate division KSB1 bacterium]MDZ7299315.1 hypothetical protein [candidate division KSB1 bacterium]MDZ7306986.1 hypothetical protein [candidate division KSB1 bacterium]